MVGYIKHLEMWKIVENEIVEQKKKEEWRKDRKK